MPALAIDPTALPPDERREIEQILAAPKILAEPESSASLVGWILLATFGAASLGLLFFWQGLGIVASPWATRGLWIAIPYALATATLAIGTFKAIAAARMQRLPWTPGRYLVTQGFLDARRRPLLFRPIANFTRVEIHDEESETTPLRLFTISVHFGDEVEKFHIFGLPQNVPRAALDELSAHRDAALDPQRSEGGYRFSRRVDVGAGVSSPGARSRLRISDHPWKIAVIAGLLATIPIYFAVLPALSLRAAERDGSVRALRAAATAYPHGWITARVRPAIHARFESARAAVAHRLSAERRAPVERLLGYLEEHDRARVCVRLVVPDTEQLAAATRVLEARTKDIPGATAAAVVLNYQITSLAGIRVGQDELTRGLESTLATIVPKDVLELESESIRYGETALDPADPVIEIASAIAPMDVFQGEGSRTFAALAFEYEASLILPGEPRALLIPKVLVLPPSNLSISRFAFDGKKPKALGSTGNPMLDRIEDGMVYTKQAETAGAAGGVKLASLLLSP